MCWICSCWLAQFFFSLPPHYLHLFHFFIKHCKTWQLCSQHWIGAARCGTHLLTSATPHLEMFPSDRYNFILTRVIQINPLLSVPVVLAAEGWIQLGSQRSLARDGGF